MHGSAIDVTLKLPLDQETRDPPAHIREDYSKSYLDYSQLNRDLYFERVILWWAQTKSLHDIYINSPNYMAAPSFRLDFDDDDHLHYCTALCLYNQLALPDELVFTSRYEKRTSVSKKRFYRAITGRFLDAKAYQFVLLFPEYPGRNEWKENIEYLWSNPGHSRTLRESLEMLEIFDFTSHFLLSRILDVDVTRRFLVRDSPLLDVWGDAMFSLQLVLTLFDILLLLLRPEQITNSRYLQDLVLQDHFHGGYSVEYSVECKLREGGYRSWPSYRRSHWRVAVRGECFSDLFDEGRVLLDIKQSRLRDKKRSRDQPSLKDWWEDLVVSSEFDDNAVLSVPFPASWLIEDGSAVEKVFATLRLKEEYHIL